MTTHKPNIPDPDQETNSPSSEELQQQLLEQQKQIVELLQQQKERDEKPSAVLKLFQTIKGKQLHKKVYFWPGIIIIAGALVFWIVTHIHFKQRQGVVWREFERDYVQLLEHVYEDYYYQRYDFSLQDWEDKPHTRLRKIADEINRFHDKYCDYNSHAADKRKKYLTPLYKEKNIEDTGRHWSLTLPRHLLRFVIYREAQLHVERGGNWEEWEDLIKGARIDEDLMKHHFDQTADEYLSFAKSMGEMELYVSDDSLPEYVTERYDIRPPIKPGPATTPSIQIKVE